MTQKLENFKVLEKLQFLKFTKIKIFLKLPKMHNLKKITLKIATKKHFTVSQKRLQGEETNKRTDTIPLQHRPKKQNPNNRNNPRPTK